MAQPDWLQLIDRASLDPALLAFVDVAELTHVVVRSESAALRLHLSAPLRLSLTLRPVLAEAIATSCFPGLPVSIELVVKMTSPPTDPAGALAEAWAELCATVKAQIPRLNGTLESAEWQLDGQNLELSLQSPAHAELFEGSGGALQLQQLIEEELGLRVAIRASARRREEPEAPAPAAVAADPFEAAAEAPLPPEPVYSDPAHALHESYFGEWMQRQSSEEKRLSRSGGSGQGAAKLGDRGLLRGRAIPAEAIVREIATVTEEENRIVVEGEIVNLDVRDLKSGRQLISFGVCDLLRSREGTLGDTLPVKLFRDPEKEPDYLAQLKNGVWVRVRGNVQLDKFSQELTMLVDDLIVGSKPSRPETWEGTQRIELHAHTTMSAMDGMIDPEDLVNRAIKWGHAGVAVTDHGVTQAFPSASHVKTPENFKLIYGCEFYLVDDGTPIIVRPPKGVAWAEADVVVLDIETTGFSPIGDDIIEVGAVRYKNGVIGESFQRFVRPSKPIPEEVQKLTNITPDMVVNAPEPAEALREFFDFIGSAIIVAHNATFDYSFLRYHRMKHLGEEFPNPVLDTLILGRSLMPHMRSHTLAALTKELAVELVDHHRADADARTAAMVMIRLLEKAEGVVTVEDLNNLTAGMNVEQLRPYHVSCLVKEQPGMKNLYKLITKSHIEYYNRTPRVPRTELAKHREGLLIGSATYGGALYDALLHGVPEAELEQLVDWYDYLEILPLDCLRFLQESGQVNSEAQLLDLTRKIVELGERMSKPVVAVSDAHFMEPYQQIFRRILKGGIGFRDEHDAPFYLRTTAEMMKEFAFLGPERCEAVVITNTHKIAALIENVHPVPNKLFPPVLEGSEVQTRELSYIKAKRFYGDPLPEKVGARLEKELQAIIGNGFAVSYYISHLLVKKSNEMGYLVGSRGSVGSSFVAWAMDITEVNALPPHYVCTDCHFIEWHDDGKTGSGFDLPRKDCPQCGKPLYRDGQDIPFETFLGFKGDKVPDIDLNFSGDVQSKIQKYSEELLGGEKYVFKAGTVGTIADKTAYGMVKGWLEDTNRPPLREAHVGYLASGVAGVKRTTGQHPGGMVVCPVGMEIEEVTPVQFPADDKKSGVKTTHYDYHSFEQALMKLDILGHDDPTMLKMLQDLNRAKTGDETWDIRNAEIDDPDVLRLFSEGGNRPLGIPDGDLSFDLGTIVLPEMGTRFVRQMLIETAPKNFSDLVRISGLSHGTDVWTNNAQDLIKKGTCTLRTCIPCRDDIMVYLMYQGMEPATAFKIMESVRKGKGVAAEMEEAMNAASVPEWYIQSCKTIKYMFPKAHAGAYVLSCLRIAWFKVHEPLLFYATYFTVRAGSVDAELITKGPEAVRRYVEEVVAKGRDASPKEKDSLTEYELVEEAYLRGIRFAKIDLWQSAASRYQILPDGRLLCPFNSLAGLGDNAAQAIVEARAESDFVSIDDLKSRARLNKSVIELLEQHGCLVGLPEGNQLTFF